MSEAGVTTRRHRAGPTPGDRRRARMLTALHRLLESQPFSEISIVEVTRAAGVTRQAFYFYFPNKAAAVGELLSQTYEGIFRLAPWFDRRDGDSLSQLRDGMDTAVRRWREHAGLMAGVLDAAGADPEVRALWQGWIEEFTARAAGRITDDRAAGVAPGGGEAGTLARVLVGATFQAMEQDVRDLRAGVDPPPDVAAALFEVWRRAAYTGEPLPAPDAP